MKPKLSPGLNPELKMLAVLARVKNNSREWVLNALKGYELPIYIWIDLMEKLK